MGSKNALFTYNDLEFLSDDQLIRRFYREYRSGTYSNPKIRRWVRRTERLANYYDYTGKLTYENRRNMINFQYYNDPHALRPEEV